MTKTTQTQTEIETQTKTELDMFDISFDDIELIVENSENKKIEDDIKSKSTKEIRKEFIEKESLSILDACPGLVIHPEHVSSFLIHNLFEDYTFFRNMADRGRVFETSTFNLNIFEHDDINFLRILEDHFLNEYDKRIVYYSQEFYSDNATHTATDIKKEASRAKSEILNSVQRVYGSKIDAKEKSGKFKEKKSRKFMFNLFSNPEVREYYQNYALISNNCKTTSCEKHFDFSKYKSWGILLNNLTNPDQNKMFYQNGDKAEINPTEHFLKYLNYSLNNIGKTNLMPIFVSPQPGAGKGILIKVLFEYIFDEYFTTINNKTLTGGFNHLLENKLFVVYDEGQVEKRDFTKVGAQLKNLATESTVTIERKGIDQKNMENNFNMIINTNRIRCIPLDVDDRRAWVFLTHHRPLEERVTKEFGYKSIQQFIKSLVAERDEFLKDLFTFNFDHEELISRPIMSDAKKAMISSTNTMSELIISSLRNNDEKGVRDFYSSDDSCENEVEYLIENMKAGFIDNRNCKFIYNSLRNEADKNTTQSRYFDIHLNASKNRKYTVEETSKVSSYTIREINTGVINQELFSKRVNEIKGTSTLF